eukprot:7385865-Prymnesium_polylepis.3
MVGNTTSQLDASCALAWHGLTQIFNARMRRGHDAGWMHAGGPVGRSWNWTPRDRRADEL